MHRIFCNKLVSPLQFMPSERIRLLSSIPPKPKKWQTWKTISVRAIAASSLLFFSWRAFSYYRSNFANYNKVYALRPRKVGQFLNHLWNQV